MATDKQIEYIKSLYEQLGMDSEDDVDDLSNREASDRITELRKMLDKDSGTDDCYWY